MPLVQFTGTSLHQVNQKSTYRIRNTQCTVFVLVGYCLGSTVASVNLAQMLDFMVSSKQGQLPCLEYEVSAEEPFMFPGVLVPQTHYLAPLPLASFSLSSLMKILTSPSPTPSLPSSNPGQIATARFLPSPLKLNAATLLVYF